MLKNGNVELIMKKNKLDNKKVVSWVLNDLEIWPMVYHTSLLNIWILVIVVLQFL